MVENLNEFNNLVIAVNGKPVKLNTLGALKLDEDIVIVLSDMPELGIEPNEYEIFHLERNEGTISLRSIEDEDLYNQLCELWEAKLEEIDNG